jgi:Leucine-rich repeat (LRR) protein
MTAFAVLSTCAGCGPSSTSEDSVAPNAQDGAREDANETAVDSPDASETSDAEAAAVRDTSPTPAPITTSEQLAEALKEVNPEFAGQVHVQHLNAEVAVVGINDRNLKDIRPLSRMRLGKVDLSMCDISDLTPLARMPLMTAYLEDNPQLSDISPLSGMPLRELYLSNTRVENLGPLRGAPLVEVNLVGTRVKDLGPLSESPIQMLWLSQCPVRDITPLKKVPLVSLTLEDTQVDDISPLANHSVQRLHIGGTKVTDLTPLGQMRLTRLIFTPSRIKKGIDFARNMPTLTELGANFDNRMPPPAFWKMHDDGQLD